MIPLDALTFHGHGLSRPECVLAHRSGLLFVADWAGDGGVAAVAPDGRVTRIAARGLPSGLAEPLRPNGIALEAGGSFLIAHLGDETGGVFRLGPDGRVEAVVTEVAGRPLPPTNFVVADALGRLWITVSTRLSPRHRAARPDVADEFVVVVPPGGSPRIVADGLGYTNECLVAADGGALLVNETFGKRVSRFEILADDGTLGPRETVATFGAGTFPDGLAAAEDGSLWVTSIVSNRVIRLHPDGRQEIVVEDGAADEIAETERLFQAGALDTARLTRLHGRVLKNVSSLAFGDPDLATAYLGCLRGEAIAAFQAPVRGLAPVHFDADLGPLPDILAGRAARADTERTLP